MSSRKDGIASTSQRRIPDVADVPPEEAAQAWLTQARRLLAVMDRPAGSAKIETTPDGPIAVVELPEARRESAEAILEWALEAAARVLRGDPQPSDAEVYKAARGLPG
ncbi:MAG: hypothetical protein OYL92_13895 [Acidobacteriota bacterium]|nr:hypothetical protein [Acidobacteriota bacterium]MDE3266052.1 hypothetical protein [Acidobacteriota bacterium]